MRKLQVAALTGLVTIFAAGSAVAADLITVPTSAPAAEVPVYDEPGFDWSGFYAGVNGGIQNNDVAGMQYGLGVQAGVNAQLDFYLLGAEVAVQGIAGGDPEVSTTYGQILGRAGLVVTDDVAIYAAGGYGIDLGVPEEQDILAGGGIEMAVSDNMSVRAQYLHAFPTQGDNSKDQFSLGANFHF